MLHLQETGWGISPEQYTHVYLANNKQEGFCLVFSQRAGSLQKSDIFDWSQLSAEFQSRIIAIVKEPVAVEDFLSARERGIIICYSGDLSAVDALAPIRQKKKHMGLSDDGYSQLLSVIKEKAAKEDVSDVVRLARLMLVEHKNRASSYIDLINILKNLGCVNDTESIAKAGMERFPDRPEIAIQFAELSARSEDWENAMMRWEDVSNKFPIGAWGWVGRGEVCRSRGLYEQANDWFTEARIRFQEDRAVAWHWAFICHHLGSWEEASRRWEILRSQWPNSAEGFAGGMAAARERGDLGLVQAIYQSGSACFSADKSFRTEAARLASAKLEWQEAVSNWSKLAADYPDDEAITEALRDARMQMVLFGSSHEDL